MMASPEDERSTHSTHSTLSTRSSTSSLSSSSFSSRTPTEKSPTNEDGLMTRKMGSTSLADAVVKVRQGCRLRDPHHGKFGVDARDVKTPDAWVPRHPDMVRLTGMHPFNAESPMPALMQAGQLTPNSLHYTRNHGAVPRLNWAEHRVEVRFNGRSVFFSMNALAKLPQVSVAVTLTCAGNRRKEENMTKQTVGFSWNTSATSTSVWTGVRMSDLLCRAGVAWLSQEEFDTADEHMRAEAEESRYVLMTGADKLPNGFYGTSLPLGHVMDPANDVLLAIKHNGEWLHPDRGFPVRAIIPGWIGGRMVKWLTTLEVRSAESDSHYHYFDNRILPSHVDKTLADAEDWWKRPEYLFNELNINSALVEPVHNSRLRLDGTTVSVPLRGYAYSGGGRKVTRVEVTLDGGKSWRLATLQRSERANRFGKHWCWVFWELQMPIVDLMQGTTVAVRAWDEANNTQPHGLTWNVMGMGNSCWFRVQVVPSVAEDGRTPCLRFVYPTQGAGLNNHDAWMVAPVEPSSSAPARGGPGNAVAASASSGGNLPKFSAEEVARHVADDDCWIIVRDKVYDCTPFLAEHPGGASSITMNAGEDCTEDFEGIHSSKAWNMLDEYLIGHLDLSQPQDASSEQGDGDDDDAWGSEAEAERDMGRLATGAPAGAAAAAAAAAAAPFSTTWLNPKRYVDFMLTRKTVINHNTILLRFSPPENVNRASLTRLLAFQRSTSSLSLAEMDDLQDEKEELLRALHIDDGGDAESMTSTASPASSKTLGTAAGDSDIAAAATKTLGLPVGQHILVKTKSPEHGTLIRAYTPLIDVEESREDFSLLVKVYRPNPAAGFPQGGKMSTALDQLILGDMLSIKGPLGHISYEDCRVVVDGKPRKVQHMAFIVGGTGITPAFRIISAALQNRRDTTIFHLLYANRSCDDILLRAELDELARRHPLRFHCWYTVSKAPEGTTWEFDTGRISMEMIQTHIPSGADRQCFVGLCGPQPMIDQACMPCLRRHGFHEDDIGCF